MVCVLLSVSPYEPMVGAAAVFEFIARNWALMSIATTVALLIIVPTAFCRKYVRIAINLIDDFAPPHFPDVPVSHVTGDPVDFSAFDGHRLRGAWYKKHAGTVEKGVIIFAHEFGTDRFSHSRYSEPLRNAGYDVFAFDFRGHGESPSEENYKPRQFPSDRERSDMLGAIAFVGDQLEEAGRPREVGLFGLSRGGGAAILASVGIASVKAVAVDGGFSSDSVVQHLAKRWASIFAKMRFSYESPPPSYWRFMRWLILINAERRFGCEFPSVRKALKRIGSTPLLFIHGERDTYIPLEQTQMLYDLAADPKYFWSVPGARHNQSIIKQPQEYARRLIRFYDTYLARCTAPVSGDRESLSGLAQPIAEEPTSPLAARITEPTRSVQTRAR